MQLQGDAADNPDQRIAEDVKLFVERTLDIGLGLLSSVVTLVSFVVILWGLSAAAPLHLFGNEFAIPGYLVWGALIYAIFGTALTQWIGSPLVNLDFQQQRCEADFRFNLVRARENSEQIALLQGEPAERERLLRPLQPRGRELVRHHEPHQAADRLHRELRAGRRDLSLHPGGAGLFRRQDPARRHDADRIRLRQRAEGAVVLRLDLPHARRMARRGRPSRRIRDVDRKRRRRWRRAPTSIRVVSSDGGKAIDLRPAAGAAAATARRWSSADGFSLRAGERTLITGPSGSGKSTLFRAIAGIWPFGKRLDHHSGRRHADDAAAAAVFSDRLAARGDRLSRRSRRVHADQVRRSARSTVGLPQLAPRLDEEAHWNRMLSLGEQQRLGVARALLHAPQYPVPR